MNTFEGDGSSGPLPSEVSKNFLKAIISGREPELEVEDLDIFDDIISDDNFKNIDDELIEESNEPDFMKEIADIYKKCESDSKSCLGNRDNLHFNVNLARKLLDFCKTLPIWSGVMVPYFGFGQSVETSASSESLFKELKREVFQKLPVRLDEFLSTHISYLTGASNLLGARKDAAIKDNEKMEGVNTQDSEENLESCEPHEISLKYVKKMNQKEREGV